MIELPLADITLDEDLQPRARIDQQTREDYVYAIADGKALPPVTVVFDGTKHWLADGYHRFYAHETLGLPTIAADVRTGNALDAVRISLAANAEHRKRREAGDYRKAYGIAVRFELVAPTDTDAVATLLSCSVRWAEVLTRDAREAERAKRDAAIPALKAEGQSNVAIAKQLGVAESTVRNVLASQNAKPSENASANPERQAMPHLPDMFSAVGDGSEQVEPEPPAAPPPDPYAGTREAFSEKGQRWHRALEALRLVNAQAEVPAMFRERYAEFDHAIGPELERAHAWINDFHRRFFGE